MTSGPIYRYTSSPEEKIRREEPRYDDQRSAKSWIKDVSFLLWT